MPFATLTEADCFEEFEQYDDSPLATRSVSVVTWQARGGDAAGKVAVILAEEVCGSGRVISLRVLVPSSAVCLGLSEYFPGGHDQMERFPCPALLTGFKVP